MSDTEMLTEPSICEIPYSMAVRTSSNMKFGSPFLVYIICLAYSADMLGFADIGKIIYFFITDL